MMEILQLQQQAATCLEQGHYSEAIALYQECIAIAPTSKSNYWRLGLAWLLAGEESQAQAIWMAGLTQDESFEQLKPELNELVQVLTAEGNRQLQLKHLLLAEQVYRQILELDANHVEAFYNLGIAVAERGDFEQAMVCWQRSVELEPKLAAAYHNQGYTLQQQDRYSEAIPYYSKALEVEPNLIETLYNLGICFLEQNQVDEGIACFQQILQLEPNYTPAYGELGYAFLVQGKFTEAIYYFKLIVRSISKFAQNYWNWYSNLAKEDLSESITTNANFIKALLAESLFDICFYLSDILIRNSKLDLVVLLDQQIPQIKLSSKTYLLLGKALAQQGNTSEAIPAYRSALAINPNLAEIYLELGKSLATSGELNQAITCFEQAIGIEPSSAEAYCNLGIVLAHQNNSDQAIACLQQVLKINSNLSKLVYDTMIGLAEQGKLDQSSESFKRLLPVDPPNNFYQSTSEWAVTHSLNQSNYQVIYPQNYIYLTPPQSLGRIDFAFRFGDKIELPEAFVAIVPKARYWLDPSHTATAIISSENKVLADVSPDFPVLSPGHPDKHPSKHLIFSVGKLPPVQKVDGTVAILSGLLNNVYFHWMFDILPRIELLRLSQVNINSIDLFLINNFKSLRFHQETLDILGIPAAKRLEGYNYPHLKADRLVVPSFPGTVAWMPKWACEFLRREFLNKTDELEKIKFLYITRKNAQNRRIINEAEVIELLDKFGFRSITLESMSVVEQATLLANTKVVIASHGSGLTNIVFCSPGTKVIEIFSPNYIYPCYWLVSNLVGLKYYYLIGESFGSFYFHKMLYSHPGSEDFFVDIKSLLQLLKFAEVV